jgi:kynureninase
MWQTSEEWARDLVGGWDHWIDLPFAVGDRLGRLIGAAAGQVVVCDSTTVNLYKLASAALEARSDRSRIVALAGDFPTDRYVLQGLAAQHGRQLLLVENPDELDEAISDATALVCVSHVHFVTGHRVDGARLTRSAHDHGALILLDLAHSAGAVPVALDGWDADLAVGCTYKYLNAGPGAPGFLYVNRRLQDELRQPIWGWFGQSDQFAMGPAYEPAPGPRSNLTGTPGVVALRVVDAAIGVTEAAGIERLWAKSVALTELLMERTTVLLEPLGARLDTPRDPHRRGAHVSIRHPDAWPWCRALIDRKLVVGDFRPPDAIRLGPAPLYTGFVDCYDAVDAMADVLTGGLDDFDPGSHRVT